MADKSVAKNLEKPSRDWLELQLDKAATRFELVLSGEELDAHIQSQRPAVESEDDVLPAALFSLTQLNYLSISGSAELRTIPGQISQLHANLTQLSFCRNAITQVAPELSRCTALKYLDLSGNVIAELPETLFDGMRVLETLNLSSNRLRNVPPLRCGDSSAALKSVFLANNLISSLKLNATTSADDVITTSGDVNSGLSHVMELDLSGNLFEAVTWKEASVLRNNVKRLDLSANRIASVCAELSLCARLKELHLEQNPLRGDNRLRKAVESRSSTSQLLALLKKGLKTTQQVPLSTSSASSNLIGSKKKRRNRSSASTIEEANDQLNEATDDATTASECAETQTKTEAKSIKIIKDDAAQPVYFVAQSDDAEQRNAGGGGSRAHLVMCAVRNYSFYAADDLRESDDATPSAAATSGGGDATAAARQLVKSFMKFQTGLHKSAEFCKGRKMAAIATHDLDCVRFPVRFTRRPAHLIRMRMLNHPHTGDVITAGEEKPAESEEGGFEDAAQIYYRLVGEAELERKQKKRNQLGGVYQFLNQIDIEDARGLPVMYDSWGGGGRDAISLPPLTNGHRTRITPQTRNILLEVSGSDLRICKAVCEQLIGWLAEHHRPLPSSQTDTMEERDTEDCLIVQQIRITSAQEKSSIFKEDDYKGAEVHSDDWPELTLNNLKVVFPAKNDLINSKFHVVRQTT